MGSMSALLFSLIVAMMGPVLYWLTAFLSLAAAWRRLRLRIERASAVFTWNLV